MTALGSSSLGSPSPGASSPVGTATGRSSLTNALLDIVRVPWMAAILLWRHCPALLAACLLGLGVRQGFVWLGVVVSEHSSTAAILLLPFAGLTMLVALIAMLWLMQPSLPQLGEEATGPGSGGIGATIASLTGLLIPFLAVYASQGLLSEDGRSFVYTAVNEEAQSSFFAMDFGRTSIASGWGLVAFVLVVFALRRAIELFGLEKRWTGFGLLGAYLEALWLMTLGATVASWFQQIAQWITERRIIAGILSAWSDLTQWLGPVGRVLDAAVGLLTGMSEVVVVPVAWLTVGALVYGAELKARETSARRTGSRRLEPARRAVRAASKPITAPVEAAWGSLRKVAVAGIMPMVFFCLVFVVATQVSLVAGNAARWLLGPHDAMLSVAVEPYATLVARVCYFLVAIPLLAAAIERIIVRSGERADADDAAAAESTSAEITEPA